MLAIAAEGLDSPDARRLVTELDGYLMDLYPPEDNFLSLPVADLFLVARDDGVAVGCGAVRFIDDTTAEVKRMYVAESARRNGVGRRLLAELESFARLRGASRLVLETGERQVEALALYARCGFVTIPCFGEYAASRTSVCLEKRLLEEE